MTLEEFQNRSVAPEGLDAPLLALWHDGQGDWQAAHHAVQDDVSAEGAWVHAYLHRKEGDQGNARYWYARAGRAFFEGSLEKEWRCIAQALLRD